MTELIKSRVDVIVVTGDLSIRTVQQATTTMPILGLTDDMVGSGLVKSLARPDGNTTGVSILAADLDGKRQEILIEAVPGLRHMALLSIPTIQCRGGFRNYRTPPAHATSSFRFIRLPNRRKSRHHRRGEGIGRRRTKRLVSARSLRQSRGDYSTRRGTGLANHLSISGRSGGRWLYWLRLTCYPNLSGPVGRATRQALARR